MQSSLAKNIFFSQVYNFSSKLLASPFTCSMSQQFLRENSQKFDSNSYESTMQALDILITASSTFGLKQKDVQLTNLDVMRTYLKDLSLDITKLPCIHIAGTKGKGSTASFCESILRKAGYKTGLYTSPHILDVRERIKIDGEPISKEKFQKYFWICWKALENGTQDQPSMATYFRFLTLLSFLAFQEEKVDVAVVEVGIGGRLDATNVVVPAACGLTSIGFDHEALLGYTLKDIGWEKAGIMKPGKPSFTNLEQSEEALQSFMKRSTEINAPLLFSPSLESYQKFSPNSEIKLGINGDHQKMNATLAISLAREWILKNDPENYKKLGLQGSETDKTTHFAGGAQLPVEQPFALPKPFLQGLAETVWPCRCEIVRISDMNYYLDGAHTFESIFFCTKWFESEHEKCKDSKNALVFFLTGDRKPETLLKPLVDKLDLFDTVIFVPPTSHHGGSNPADDAEKQQACVKAFMSLVSQRVKNLPEEEQTKILEHYRTNLHTPKNISDTQEILIARNKKIGDLKVLVTGSFYIVSEFKQLSVNEQTKM